MAAARARDDARQQSQHKCGRLLLNDSNSNSTGRLTVSSAHLLALINCKRARARFLAGLFQLARARTKPIGMRKANCLLACLLMTAYYLNGYWLQTKALWRLLRGSERKFVLARNHDTRTSAGASRLR